MVDFTEQEEIFLEALFDTELNPDMDADIAKQAAGYPKSKSTLSLLRKLKSRLQDDTQLYFLSIAPKAAAKVTSFMGGNTVPGDERVLAAALQILDRAGIMKEEKQKIELEIPIGVVMLPPIRHEQTQNFIESSANPQIGNGEVATQTYI